jgi:O-acetylhomoserine/O-acetylserine sulfhydrylase-like pyridoxal-dependent enzyme
MTEPSRGYHGVRFYETFGDFGFTMRARFETLRTLGPALAPLNAWLLLQGLETLPCAWSATSPTPRRWPSTWPRIRASPG